MRYPKEHKEQARQRLVERGGRHAKRHGFADSGVHELAAAAGVTTGSLYKHFAGKADLFAALIRAELQRSARMFSSIAPDDHAALAKAIAAYLSLGHVAHPEAGCALPSLTPEVARADASVRDTFQHGLLELHAAVSRLTRCDEKAWTLIAQCVGAVMLARALPDDEVRRAVLGAVEGETRILLGRSPRDSQR